MTVDRTPKPCLHKQAEHEHGSRLGYMLDGCRCLPCCAANAEYETRRTKLRAYARGTPTGLVDAGPVRSHVEALQAAGMGWKRIAVAAGVPNGTMSRLLFGKPEQGCGPSKRINPDAAARLLALPMPTPELLGGGAVIDGTGTRRRLQALVANGWTQTALATRLGMSAGNFGSLIHGHHRKAGAGRVLVSTHRAVVALYKELADRPGPPSRGRANTVAVAQRHGWQLPIAWDDDTIDDPLTNPALDEAAPGDVVDEFVIDLVLDGQPMNLTGRELEVAALRLSLAGHDYATIAARCRTDEKTVRRVLNSARQRTARAAEREAA